MFSLPAVPKKYAVNRKMFFSHCIIICFALTSFALPVQAAFETATDLSAKSILKPDILKGKNHTVEERVANDGLFNHYTVDSPFGVFQASSTSDLKVLINEINAIADMKKVETDDAAIAALKQSGINTVDGVKNLVNDPQGVLQGAVTGVTSLFNRAKETVGKRKIGDEEDNKLEQLVGISKSKGKLASKYGVNVYSSNKVLQAELDRLGQADFFGGLSVGVATSFVPGIGGLVLSTSGTARLLNEAINNTPASELWLQNKKKLLAVGMNADTVELFLNNPTFNPARSTVLVAALEQMKGVDNLDLFLKVSLQASDPAMAALITKITVLTAAYHKEISPLKTVRPMARLTMAVRKDGTRIVLLPTDYIIWNEKIADTVSALTSEGKGNGLELWVLGTVSQQAVAEFTQREWKVQTRAGSKLIPDQQ